MHALKELKRNTKGAAAFLKEASKYLKGSVAKETLAKLGDWKKADKANAKQAFICTGKQLNGFECDEAE